MVFFFFLWQPELTSSRLLDLTYKNNAMNNSPYFLLENYVWNMVEFWNQHLNKKKSHFDHKLQFGNVCDNLTLVTEPLRLVVYLL